MLYWIYVDVKKISYLPDQTDKFTTYLYRMTRSLHTYTLRAGTQVN